MSKSIFSKDLISRKKSKIYERIEVKDFAAKIEAYAEYNKSLKAQEFSKDINENKFADFEKPGDKMCHVSSFIVKNDSVYMSYYASRSKGEEDPESQVARLAYCKKCDPKNIKYIDIQAAGDTLEGKKVTTVYDTIMMCHPDEPDNIYLLWTASINKKYYRLYRTFNIKTETLGEIGVNRFTVGEITNDFSFSGIKNALVKNNIGYKEMYADIGIMQKQSWRMENGVNYCYTGAYSGNFACIIKSCDLVNWEYVAQPNEGADGSGFDNETRYENAVYVLRDMVYYCVRQWEPIFDDKYEKYQYGTRYAILTSYDLISKKWAKPVLVGDSQSRSDFILYRGELYLFHASISREHIGILKINKEDISKTEVVLQANMNSSCFYPFVQYFDGEKLAISYTVSRKHIRLATFELEKYL